MSSKQFPPTDLKLERLRKAGAFAYSAEVTLFSLLLALGIVAYLFSSLLGPALLTFMEAQLGSEAFQQEFSTNDVFPQTTRLMFLALFSCIVPLVVAGSFAVLVQSRFLVNFLLLAIDFGRMFSLERNLKFKLSKGFSLLLKTVIFLLAITLLLRLLMLNLVSLIDSAARNHSLTPEIDTTLHLGDYSTLLRQFWLGLAAATFLVAIFSYMHEFFGFRKTHWMTRKELEEELREDEVSQETKQARADVQETL